MKRTLAGVAGILLIVGLLVAVAALGSAPERRARVSAAGAATATTGDVGVCMIGVDSPCNDTTTSSSTTTTAPPAPTSSTTVVEAPPSPNQPCPSDVPECSVVNCTLTPDNPVCPRGEEAPQPAQTAVSGAVSQSWLDRLALCESGGENAPRTGWFGIEAGAGVMVGDLSYADQVAWVERILAETGPSAWSSYTNGCVPAPY